MTKTAKELGMARNENLKGRLKGITTSQLEHLFNTVSRGAPAMLMRKADHLSLTQEDVPLIEAELKNRAEEQC